MAYDFAKRKKKRKSSKKADMSGRPSWFFTGLACGVFVSFLLQLNGVYFIDQTEPTNKPDQLLTQQPPETKTKAASTSEPTKSPRFEFYTVLQNQQLKTDQTSKTAYKTREELQQAAVSYLLQAGSFANARDAESRRATITLMNMVAQVETAKLDTGATAHRVYVGPYADRATMQRARDELHSEGIETLLMEKK